MIARWKARLAIRRALLKAAQVRVSEAHKGLLWAERNHRQSITARVKALDELRKLVAKRLADVSYAERILARHSLVTKVSNEGLKLVASFEGDRLSAYQDTAGVWTIGYGHTGAVYAGEKISQSQALTLLRRDLDTAASAVRALGLHLSQGQFDALTSLAYNCGGGILGSTTLGAALRAHSMSRAATAFLLYDHDIHGHLLAGLQRRREAEQKLFLTSDS